MITAVYYYDMLLSIGIPHTEMLDLESEMIAWVAENTNAGEYEWITSMGFPLSEYSMTTTAGIRFKDANDATAFTIRFCGA